MKTIEAHQLAVARCRQQIHSNKNNNNNINGNDSDANGTEREREWERVRQQRHELALNTITIWCERERSVGGAFVFFSIFN